MRVLVLGGTVFLSHAVAEEARDRGHEVTAAARGQSGTVPDGVRLVHLDRDRPDGLAPLTEGGSGYDAVVDVTRQPGQARRALALLAERARHWTFVSSGSVYADNSTPNQRVAGSPLVEPHPDDDSSMESYGPRKVACEEAVRAAAGDRAMICRAGLIVGPGDVNDRFGYWPLRLARGGEVLAPGSPGDPVQVIDVRDLAAWIVRAAEDGVAGTFDGVGPVMTRADFLARIAAGVGVEPRLTWVDQAFVVGQGVEPWMGPRSLPLWLPLPEYAGFMTRDDSPSVAAGLVTRDLADTARDTLAWERSVDGSHKLIAGLTAEEEAELLRAWHAR
jgi:2'-hydroxyisoflavone reductase